MIIKQIRVVDPSTNTDEIRDLYLQDGKITDQIPQDDTPVIDGQGLVAFPGLVDMHVHLRDPGFTYKEDMQSGTNAAAAGGFTAVCCMPNTNPVLDTPAQMAYIYEQSAQMPCRVFPVAAVTQGQKGAALTDFGALKSAGAVALSDDGVPVDSAYLLRGAMQAAKKQALCIISHCEDREMVANHGANEGIVSAQLQIPGRPAVAESIQVARDILLAEDTGAHVHIAHISTAKTVELIRRAKADGLPVTCETCPQYFTLTEEALLTQGSLARVNPPLRTEADRLAIIRGLEDGTIDAIVTDHAPHSFEEKSRPIPEAQSGMVGLETSLALTLTMLYHSGKLSLLQIASLMSFAPSKILGLPYGTLQPGAPADITIFDPNATWSVDPAAFLSKGRNTPFSGMELTGRVRYTIVNGKVTFKL